MVTDEGGGVEEVEGVTELNVLGATLLANVERRAHFLHLLPGPERPETLELGVVEERQEGMTLGSR